MPFPPDVRERLERMGAEFVSEDLAYLTPKPAPPATVLEYSVKDTTPLWRKVKQQRIRSYTHRNILTVKEYGVIQGIFRKVCTLYHDPKIEFRLVPVKARNITLHVFSGRITGEIVNEFTNESEEGEEGYYKTWRWRACPTDEDYYSWHEVPGSADLDNNWLHEAIEEETGKLIARVTQKAAVRKGDRVEVSASFETSGLLDVIWTLLEIFWSGRVTTRDGYDVTIRYKWKGETQTVNRHVDARVILPVEGNVGVSWS